MLIFNHFHPSLVNFTFDLTHCLPSLTLSLPLYTASATNPKNKLTTVRPKTWLRSRLIPARIYILLPTYIYTFLNLSPHKKYHPGWRPTVKQLLLKPQWTFTTNTASTLNAERCASAFHFICPSKASGVGDWCSKLILPISTRLKTVLLLISRSILPTRPWLALHETDQPQVKQFNLSRSYLPVSIFRSSRNYPSK